MTMNQPIPANLIIPRKPEDEYLYELCACGCKRFDHRFGRSGDKIKRGACRMCVCRKFKVPKPIKSKIKKT